MSDAQTFNLVSGCMYTSIRACIFGSTYSLRLLLVSLEAHVCRSLIDPAHAKTGNTLWRHHCRGAFLCTVRQYRICIRLRSVSAHYVRTRGTPERKNPDASERRSAAARLTSECFYRTGSLRMRGKSCWDSFMMPLQRLRGRLYWTSLGRKDSAQPTREPRRVRQISLAAKSNSRIHIHAVISATYAGVE